MGDTATPFSEIDAWYGTGSSDKLTFGKLPAKPIDPYDIDGGCLACFSFDPR